MRENIVNDRNMKTGPAFRSVLKSFIETISSIFISVVGKIVETITRLFSKLPMELKIIILILIAGISIYLIYNKVTITTKVAATHTGYEKIDKLYTSFTVVPIIKKSYSTGFDKGIENTISFWKDKEISSVGRVNGFAVAYYNIAIGYDQVSEKIGPFIGKQCPRNSDSLPEPVILSIKADVNPPEGDAIHLYKQLYVTPSNREIIKRTLMEQLDKRGQWDEIKSRGKSVLNAYISLYCIEEN